MALLRWHTPTPDEPIPVKAATTPMASATILASLMKQTNYKDFDEFETFAFYPVIFPNRWKPEMFRQPDRFVYQMRSEILVQSEPAKALLLQQELSQQVAQRAGRNGRTIPTVPEPPMDQQHGAESARDHLGADNVIRHMHPHTGSAYNAWARPKGGGGDPYLGTGLNPAHVSGVELPVGEDRPIMACCGQPFDALDRTVVDTNGTSHRVYEWVAPSGCWSRLDTRQPYGLLVPYQVWFTTDDPARLWQRIITQQTNLFSETVTGTAFIDASYYGELDRQIRALVTELAPVVQRVHQQLLTTAFAQPSGVALLLKGERDRLIQLVLLVQRYNAPQMGACHHDQTVGDDYLDERVFFVSVGKTEMQQGRLVVNVTIAGRKVPLVFRPTVEAFQKTLDALSGTISAGNLEPLRNVISLITEAETNQQWLSLAKSANDATIIKARQAPLSVGLLDILEIRISNLQSLYQAAEKLAAEMQNLLATLPMLTSDWIQSGANGSPPNSIVVAIVKGKDIIRRMNIDDITEVRTELEELLPLFETTPKEISNVITKDDTLRPYANKPEVQAWARASVIAEKIATVQFRARERLLVDKRVAELYAAALAVAVAAAEVKKTTIPLEPAFQPEVPSSSSQRRTIALMPRTPIREPTIPDVKLSLLRPGYKYGGLSCSFDTLFAALFMIPKQWFREKMTSATQVDTFDTCKDNVEEVHGHLLQVIEYMEKDRKTPTICPTFSWWQPCMRTRPLDEPQSRVDDPAEMLSSLANFYRIRDGLLTISMDSADTFTQFDEPAPISSTELILVQLYTGDTTFPRLYPSIPVTSPDGAFSITACILHSASKGHWQVCIRDPRTNQWYRYDDDGVAYLLATENPVDIRGLSYEPRELLQNKTGYSYQPVYWFYVRSRMLAPLLPRFVVNRETFKGALDNTDRVALFGRDIAQDNLGLPLAVVSKSELEAGMDLRVLGIMQILYNLNSNPVEQNEAYRFRNFDVNWSWPFTVDKVNTILRPRLQHVFGSVLIDGKDISYALFLPDVLSTFRRVGLIDKDNNVPLWNDDLLSIEWKNSLAKNIYWNELGKIWALSLRYFFQVLRETKNTELEQQYLQAVETAFQNLANLKPSL